MNFASGAPKCCTHYLQKYLRLYQNIRPSEVYQCHYRYGRVIKPGDKLINIIRNPRNMMISWHRMRNKNSKIPTSLICKIPEVIKQTKPFLGWLNDKKVLNVRYEDLMSDDDMLLVVGDFIDRDPIKNHRAEAWSNTRTFTGNPSIWQEHKEYDEKAKKDKILWTDRVQEVWEQQGGLELEASLRYDVHKPVIARFDVQSR